MAAIAALVIFVACVLGVQLLILCPVSVPLKRWRIDVPVHYAAVPPLASLLLLATGALSPEQFVTALAGDQYIQPYAIVVIFMALAYVASSLDQTGALAWLALKITRASHGRGRLLFLAYYGLSAFLTTFTSNDVSIMTLAPLILYCTEATGTDPMPFLVASFQAANVWSMMFFFGNPTNIIVAGAYNMTFAQYTRWMGLPTVVGGLASLGVNWVLHQRHLPKQLTLPSLQPSSMLSDVPGAWFGAANLAACLALLAAAPALGWSLWMVTAVCAGLHMVYNAWAYLLLRRLRGQLGRGTLQPPPVPAQPSLELVQQHGDVSDCDADADRESSVLTEHEFGTCGEQALHRRAAAAGAVAAAAAAAVRCEEGEAEAGPAGPHPRRPSPKLSELGNEHATGGSGSSAPGHRGGAPQPRACGVDAQDLCGADTFGDRQGGAGPSSRDDAAVVIVGLDGDGGLAASGDAGCSAAAAPCALKAVRPTFLRPLVCLPWEVVPFTLGMFVVVEALDVNGWLDSLAQLLGSWCRTTWLALLVWGVFSILLASAINNQPMTILATRVTLNPLFVAAVGAGAGAGADAAVAVQASSFAIVVGSNVAANFTLIGALAGIMWRNILAQHGRRVGYARFIGLLSPLGLTATVGTLATLGAQFMWV